MRFGVAFLLCVGLASVAGAARADYRVRPGDTLSGIAARFGTSVVSLERLNGLSPSRPLIAGARLVLPAPPRPEVDYRVVDGDTLSGLAARFGTTVGAIAAASGIDAARPLRLGALLRIPVARRPAAAPRPPLPHPVLRYTVRSGDTLGALALRYRTTVAGLERLNGLSPEAPLRAGAVLEVPSLPVPQLRHRVVAGDTLSGLAAQFGTTVGAIAAASGIDPARPLPVGAIVRIPVSTTPRPPVRLAVYTVRSGDTLSGIAARFGVSIGALADLNHLDPASTLPIGTRLSLPAGTLVQAPGAFAQSIVRGAIVRWSTHYGVDPRLVAALAWMESGFNNALTSAAGAVGIMQITPETWDYVQQVLLLGTLVPHTTDGNVRIGVAYLHHLLHIYGGDPERALAAYYQGARSLQLYGFLPGTARYVDDILALEQRF